MSDTEPKTTTSSVPSQEKNEFTPNAERDRETDDRRRRDDRLDRPLGSTRDRNVRQNEDQRNEQSNGQRNGQRNEQRNGQRNGQRNEQRNGQRNGQRNEQRNGQRNSRESHPGEFNPVTASVSSSLTHDGSATISSMLLKEDPRLRDASGQLVKEQKQRGGGRNTESFNPESTLVRPDMRVLIGNKNDLLAIKEGRLQLKHDDVLVVPEFFCAQDDWTIYNQLVREMREIQRKGVPRSEWISWHEGAHLISDNPSESATFQDIQHRISDYFDIEQKKVGTRFNWYKDSSDWKPFHHDSAAFNPMRAKNQNITVGVSFGASRELAFLHTKSNTRIYFPQTNGMLFSFGRDVNIQWKHGVNYIPVDEQNAEIEMHSAKVDEDITVGRISIILWGNCRMVKEEDNSPPLLTDNSRGHGHHIHRTQERGGGAGRDRQGAQGGERGGGFDRKREREREPYNERMPREEDRGRRADSRERGGGRREQESQRPRREDSRDRRPDYRQLQRGDSRDRR